jgi:riboflavin kinase/FMN adenylyltransferase
VKILQFNEPLPAFRHPVVTIGTFDGVHLGHQKIVREIVLLAKKDEADSIIISFWPHPRHLLQGEQSVALLHTLAEKARHLENLGVDYLVIIPFSRSFSELSAQDYVTDFLIARFHPGRLVIGYDHRFGKNRSGDFALLQQLQPHFGYALTEISRESLEHAVISSTQIRNALHQGNVALANALLGYSYSLNGVVIKGDQLGRKLGFPTANLLPDDAHKLIPSHGVYAVRVRIKAQEYHGVMNIGNRPTVKGSDLRIEVHLFDFNEDLYGQSMQIQLDAFIRQEKRFDSIDLLKSAIETDCIQVKNFYKHQ